MSLEFSCRLGSRTIWSASSWQPTDLSVSTYKSEVSQRPSQSSGVQSMKLSNLQTSSQSIQCKGDAQGFVPFSVYDLAFGACLLVSQDSLWIKCLKIGEASGESQPSWTLTWENLGEACLCSLKQWILSYTLAILKDLPGARWFAHASSLSLFNSGKLLLTATHLTDKKNEASGSLKQNWFATNISASSKLMAQNTKLHSQHWELSASKTA